MREGSHGIRRLVGRAWERARSWLYRRALFRFALRLGHEVKTSLYRNAIFLMANSVVGQGLGFIFWLVVARVYVPDDVGFAVTLFSTVSFVAVLAVLGQGVSLIRFLPEAENKAGLVNSSLTIVALAALLLGGGFLLFIAALGLNLSFVLDNFAYPVTILVGAVAASLGPVLDSAAIASRRADIPLTRTVILGVLKIPIAVAIAFTLSTTLGIGRFGVFLALVSSIVISVLLEGLWLLRRALPGYLPRPHGDFSLLRPMMRFSGGNYAASVVAAAGTSLLPLLILETLGSVGARNAAYFYVASAVAALLSVIPSAAFTSFYAEASYPHADRHRDERRALLLALGLLIPGIVVFWVFANWVLLAFGGGNQGYAAGGTDALRILTLASLPAVANNLFATRVRVRKRTRPLIIAATISSTVMLGLGFVLLRTDGITGLAMAYDAAALAATPYYWYAARKSFAEEPLEPTEPAPVQP